MMKVLIWGFSIIFFGCTGYQYVASPQYVPVNLEKNMVNVNFSFNYYQLGYTFSNHFSVFTTGYFRNNGRIINLDLKDQTDKQREFDLGMTYFKTLGEYLSYEIVSGAGIGSVKYSNVQDPNYNFSFDSKKFNFYLQPDFTFRYDKNLNISVFSRIIHNRYYDLNKNLSLRYRNGPEKYDEYINNREVVPLNFLEWGVQVRVGLEKVKFQFMYSGVYDLKNTGMQYCRMNAYIGLSLRLTLGKKQIK